MEETLTTLEREQDERGKVESWRLHVLMEAGFPLPIAERIAQSDADLHEAVDLIGRRGCTPEVAAQILL
jgi:hypothetical protein